MSVEEVRPPSEVSPAKDLLSGLKQSMDAVADSRRPMTVKIRTRGNYVAIRVISWCIRIVGLLMFCLGVFILISLIIGATGQSPTANVETHTLLAISVSGIVTGLLFVAVGQFMVAIADTADYARQILVLQKAIAENATHVDTRVWL